MRVASILLLVFSFAGQVAAQAQGPSEEQSGSQAVRYVNDYLIITLRSGAGDEYRILRTLPSGTHLELLEKTDGYARVRTKDGLEGWVGQQYLRETPVAREQLAELQQKFERVEQEVETLRKSNAALTSEKSRLQKENQAFNKENTKLKNENTQMKKLAAKPMALEEENTLLKKKYSEAERERLALQAENSELKGSSVQKWFMAGGGVLLLGVVMGLVLPKFKRHRRSGW